MPTVHISKNALDYFRRKARSTSNEILAYLIGEIRYPNTIIVNSLEHVKQYAVQTHNNVQPSDEEFTRVKLLAEEQGRRIVGDIHSHPSSEAIMSEPDYQACLEDGLQLCGIVGVNGQKTDVKFWTINSALPCEVSYEKTTRASKRNAKAAKRRR
jgi:proteasome lid subunit RPN8/RPN11